MRPADFVAEHAGRHFNPRTPVGCDTSDCRFSSLRPYFNPRTPVGCDLTHNPYPLTHNIFQSTHPSGVRLVGWHVRDGERQISIHAPQWGATQGREFLGYAGVISIHAPQWGATLNDLPIGIGQAKISIHAPQWGATFGRLANPVARVISIHTPQWGATRTIRRSACPRMHFNPRTPVGCDTARICWPSGWRYFNPRTPVGCDIRPVRDLAHGPDFNPRCFCSIGS